MASGLLKIKKVLVPVGASADKNKKISCGPSGPDLPGRRPYPGGFKPKTQKPIGNLGHAPKFVAIGSLGNDLLFVTIGSLGHALDFVTIGNLGNATKFVNIGNLGNGKTIAKIANDFERGNKRGGRWGRKALFIGNIGKIVMLLKLA